MTREEAIDVLKHNYPSSCYEDLCKAVDMAVKALEQPEPCEDTISRQAAIDAINHICPVDTEYDCTLLDRVDVRCVLSDLPSVQPVIRCKDCKNFGGGTYCYERDDMWDENDFCSYAERKEQDDG